MKKIILFFISCLIIVGCTTPPKVDILAEAETIRNLEEQWTSAVQNKDIDKIMNFYATDAVWMYPNMPIINGPQAIREKLVTDFADTTILFNTISGSVDNVQVSSSGDMAFVRGNERLNIKKGEVTMEQISKWIDVWKKIDGQWKCILTIGNSDLPLKEN